MGSFRWSIILTPSSVHSIVFTITRYSSIMKGCVISAPMTGSGKTTVTLGLLETLRKRGLAVQPFKVGPDFIDPGLHEIAAGVPSHNLDGWMVAGRSLHRYSGKASGAVHGEGGADSVAHTRDRGIFRGARRCGEFYLSLWERSARQPAGWRAG